MPGPVRSLALMLGVMGAGTLACDRSSSTSSSSTSSSSTSSSSPRASSSQPTTRTTGGVLPAGDDTAIDQHVDGDTIAVRGGERVRLIGIDTPETQDPRQPVQCFGREASDFLAKLVPVGTEVRLVYDVERLDRYGRTLAYMYRSDDGILVNAELVRNGFAIASTFPPNVAHADEFATLATEAREAGRGLWHACDRTQTPAPTTNGSAACDPAYPGSCIPPPPPDLDCANIGDRSFEVLADDPHRFDGDENGVGCE